MMQQINLYLPEFRPNREALRAVHIMWGSLLFFIILIGVTGLSFHKVTALQAQLANEQSTQQQLQEQLQKLSAQSPVESSVDFDAQIEKLQQELAHRHEVLATVSLQNLGNDKGFSAQLTTLAHASLNTISLDSFSLQNGGNYVEMSGKTRTADQIPLYLQRLRIDPSFASVGFGVIKVERDQKDRSILQFKVAKKIIDDDAEKKSAGDKRK